MKILYITSQSGKRINGFMRSAVLAAKESGHQFTMACNMSLADAEGYAEDCRNYGIDTIHIDFDRNPLGKSNLRAKKQLLAVMKDRNYDAVHCNTPIGGLLGRICARKANVPVVIYQAHGFHFWKGAPALNWLIYYPIERMLARWTDHLVTINREDYHRAKKFRCKKGGRVEYVPGVGVDTKKFEHDAAVRAEKRKELGLGENEIMLLSVGELNRNKNHRVVMEALAQWGRKDVRYVICGAGHLLASLQELAQKLGIDDQVIFAGYRTDIGAYYQAADLFVIPSFREGLPASLMEAMSAGLPCAASRIRGIEDLLPESELLFRADSAEELCSVLQRAAEETVRASEVKKNAAVLKQFSMEEAVAAMKKIYGAANDEIVK